MGRYVVEVELVHTFRSVETCREEVDADSPEDAEHEAKLQAIRNSSHTGFDADHEDTSVENSEIVDGPNESDDNYVPRCDKTKDLFGGN